MPKQTEYHKTNDEPRVGHFVKVYGNYRPLRVEKNGRLYFDYGPGRVMFGKDGIETPVYVAVERITGIGWTNVVFISSAEGSEQGVIFLPKELVGKTGRLTFVEFIGLGEQ